jgi:MFS family permease
MAFNHARPEARLQIRFVLGMSGLLLGIFLGTLSNQIVNVPLKAVMSDLRVGLGQGALVVISFNLAFAVLMPVAGWAGERIGRKRIYLIALVLAGIGSVGAALAPNVAVLVGFRLLQGAGSACVLPNVMTLITSIVSPSKKARALGLWAATNGLAYAIGAPAGGLLAQWWNWRVIFLPSAVLAVAGLILSARYLPDDHGRDLELEWRGAAGLTGGATLLLLSAIAVPLVGIASVVVWGLAAMSLLPLFVFFRSATSFRRPFVSASVMGDRAFMIGSIAVSAQMFCLGATLLAVPLYLTRNAHLSLGSAGAFVLATSVSMTALAPVAGWAAERRGYAPPIWFGTALLAATELMLALLFAKGVAGAAVASLLLSLGVAVAFVQAPAATAATSSAAGTHGAALGVFNLIRFASAALGAAWVAAELEATGSYPWVFAVCSAVAFAALAATVLRWRFHGADLHEQVVLDAVKLDST